jgi:N6-adenosine-specific RNA methylase IME4
MTKLLLSEIKIGKRHRRDMGDIDALAQSIDEVGLLHPVVVDPDGRLIAGERRIAACKKLGWVKIPTTPINLDAIVRGELAENVNRKDFTPEESVEIWDAVEPLEKAAAKARMDAGRKAGGRGKKKTPREIDGEFSGDARDKVAAYAGVSASTMVKRKAVVEAAKAEPEKFGKLLADMNRTGLANGPFKRLKVARQAAVIRAEPPTLPNRGPYRVIVADPPWSYELRKADPSHRATHPYPQMTVAEICAVPVQGIAHDDCILWLWTTNHHLIRCAAQVLDAWGFVEKTILTWAKDRFGTGDWLRGQSEHCIMAVRGKPVVELKNHSTILSGPLRENSRKPEEFYTFVESLCPAPRYAYLFSREQRDNWDMHGDELK